MSGFALGDPINRVNLIRSRGSAKPLPPTRTIFFALVFIAFAIAGYREVTWTAMAVDEKSAMVVVVICSLLFAA